MALYSYLKSNESVSEKEIEENLDGMSENWLEEVDCLR